MNKRFLMLAVAGFAAVACLQGAVAQQAAQPAAVVSQATPAVAPLAITMPNPLPNEQVFDIDAPLPKVINIPPGGTITFVRHVPWVGSNVGTSLVNLDNGKDPMLHRIMYIRAPDAPKGYQIVSQYTVDRKGTGGVKVTHKVVAPRAVPQSVTIKVIAK